MNKCNLVSLKEYKIQKNQLSKHSWEDKGYLLRGDPEIRRCNFSFVDYIELEDGGGFQRCTEVQYNGLSAERSIWLSYQTAEQHGENVKYLDLSIHPLPDSFTPQEAKDLIEKYGKYPSENEE